MRLISKGCRQAKIGPTSRQVVFLNEAEESHDDIRGALHDAIKAELPTGTGYWVWVIEVWDDKFAYEYETPDGAKTFIREYTIDAEGMAEIGNPTEVEMVTEFVPVGEAIRTRTKPTATFTGQTIPLIESIVGPEGTIPIKIIEPGWGSSAYYPADVLERDGPEVFPEGTQMFWDHQTEAEAMEQPEGALDDLAAVFKTAARWEPNHPNGPGLYADAEVFGPFDEKLTDLAPHIGCSINTSGVAESGEAEGREGLILTELVKTPTTSVDYVTKAGAGGEIVSLFEAARPMKKDVIPMPETELQEKLATAEAEVVELKEAAVKDEADKTELARHREAKLEKDATDLVTETIKDIEMPDVARTRVIREAAKNPPVTDGVIDTEALATRATEKATEEAEYRESLTGEGGIHGMGGGGEEENNGRKKLEESIRHAHPKWTDQMVADCLPS